MLRRDGRALASLGLYRMGQWWGGRVVPLVGVAGVAVGAEHRREGLARGLMTALLRELRAERVPLSALYASTSRLYRGLGYERAGSYCQYALDVRRIELSERELPVTRLEEPLEPALFQELHRQRARVGAGCLERSEAIWRRVLRPEPAPPRAWRVGPAEAPRGYVILHQASSSARGRSFDLVVRDLVALDGAAARRLWTLFADQGSLAGDVVWHGPAVDPQLLLLPEQDHVVRRHEAWLLRLVDAPAALAARGWPDVSLELELELRDELLPENSGRWTLRVSRGQGEVRPGGRGDLLLDARGLAALYAGYQPPDELARLGLLEGSRSALEAARVLFAGPAPWLPDHF